MACSDSEFNFRNLWIYFGRSPWAGDQLDARPLPAQDSTTQKNSNTYIHASSGIRTHDPIVRVVKDTWLRPRGRWDLKMCVCVWSNLWDDEQNMKISKESDKVDVL
jgi:hypothetical protein